MNALYDIIHNEDNQTVFNYTVIMIIFIFVFNNITLKYSILIGMFFASIVIYYLYTDKSTTVMTKNAINTDKFEIVNPNTNIIENNKDIVDFLFYIENFKKYNIQNYYKITKLFEKFIVLYNSCLTDNALINDYYNSLNDTKYDIINCISQFEYVTFSHQQSEKLTEAQNNAEILLNNYIDKIIKINNANIKMDGYDNNTKILDTTNILPFNYKDNNLSFEDIYVSYT